MKSSNNNRSWLPQNEQEEYRVANSLLDYASKETSYTIDPFTYTANIDEEGLATIECGFLPDACRRAKTLITQRQNQIDDFFEFFWQDASGNYFKLTHILDNKTGEWLIGDAEKLSPPQ